MGQQVSVTKLKEQIEVAKRSLAEMSPVITAADPLIQPVAMQAANFAVWLLSVTMMRQTLRGQNMAPDDMAMHGDVTWRPVKTFNFSIAPNGWIGHVPRHRLSAWQMLILALTVTISRFFRRSINGLVGLKMILRRTKNISSN